MAYNPYYNAYWNDQALSGVRDRARLASILGMMGVNMADLNAQGLGIQPDLFLSRLRGGQEPGSLAAILHAINPRTRRAY